MKSPYLTAALAAWLTRSTSAHTVMTTLFVDNVDQGDGVCIRMPMTPQNATFPILNLASSDMACGKFTQ